MKQSKFNKKYKLLLLDIDGTIVPYDYTALPSEKVKEAIGKARKKLTVCLVTGRAYGYVEPILRELDLKNGFVIVNNGANVVEIKTRKIIYDQPINQDDTRKVIEILYRGGIPFYLKQRYDHMAMHEGHFKKNQKFQKAYMFVTDEIYPSSRIEPLIKKISLIPTLEVHVSKHKFPNKFGIAVLHINATKVHGIYAIEKELGIKRSDMIGVGDAYNDFSLLMACGFKIAMGNAIPELKAIADYIAPSVEEDGVVDVIEKFVLR